MFDILLGRKFSNKCKHSVKYIKCRVEIIRKKKQVMVRYLKKDVADLLAGGHDANAFGRIDALVVEINHATCYDMIEQYCGCLLEHLSTMRKERECPKDAMEAVATLIFAAARFSDLPELSELRSVFTKRYGTRMESCIDKEFVEKIQKKSFSKVTKLQLMEDIAREFSVNWNSNMFENKISNRSAHTNHGNLIEQRHVSKENGKQFPIRARQKLEILQNEQIDSQTTPINANIHAHNTTRQTLKLTADDLEVAKSDHPVHPDKKADVKTKYNQKEKYRNDAILEGNAHGRSEMVHEGIGLAATERQPSTEVVYRDLKAINMIPPPYTKLTEGSDGTIVVDHAGLSHAEASENVKGLDQNSHDGRSNRPVNASSRRTFNSQPPYRKSNANKTPKDISFVNPTTYEKPTSGQGDMSKDEIIEDGSNLMSQIQTKQGRETAKTNDIHGEVYGKQRFIIKRTPSGRRMHGSRQAAVTTKDGSRDREEEIMDRLLIHYSKKGTINEPRKTRTRTREAPKEPIADAARVPEHVDEHKRHPNTLPREQTIPAENGSKGRTQATLKPTGRVLLRQPENENPAAWIAAQH